MSLLYVHLINEDRENHNKERLILSTKLEAFRSTKSELISYTWSMPIISFLLPYKFKCCLKFRLLKRF